MQKNKQAQHKPRRNFAQIHEPRKPSSRFIRHKSTQWWGLDKKGVEGEEGLLKIHFAVNAKKQIVSM